MVWVLPDRKHVCLRPYTEIGKFRLLFLFRGWGLRDCTFEMGLFAILREVHASSAPQFIPFNDDKSSGKTVSKTGPTGKRCIIITHESDVSTVTGL